jgi:hypothetical protein
MLATTIAAQILAVSLGICDTGSQRSCQLAVVPPL